MSQNTRPRVHELAKELGREPEELMKVLAERGESAKSLSSVSVEAEKVLRQMYAPDIPEPEYPDEDEEEETAQVSDPDSPVPGILVEPSEGNDEEEEPTTSSPAPGVVELPVTLTPEDRAVIEEAAAPLVLPELPPGVEPVFEDEELSEVELQAKYGYTEAEFADIRAGREVAPPDQRFALHTVMGALKDTLIVSPEWAPAIRTALAGQKLLDAKLYPEFGEYRLVTYPDGQHITVRLDD